MRGEVRAAGGAGGGGQRSERGPDSGNGHKGGGGGDGGPGSAAAGTGKAERVPSWCGRRRDQVDSVCGRRYMVSPRVPPVALDVCGGEQSGAGALLSLSGVQGNCGA